jgi:DNA-binding NtrC family response regulator
VERIEDVPELAHHFLADFGRRHQVHGLTFSAEAMMALRAHHWPGNIRELRAVVENAAIVTRSGLVGREHIEAALLARSETPESWQGLAAAPVTDAEEVTHISSLVPAARPPAEAISRGARAPSLPDLQRDMILRAFEESRHNLSKAAQDLGIPRTTLRARLRRYGVR